MGTEFKFSRKSIQKNYNISEISETKEFLLLIIKIFFCLLVIYVVLGYVAEVIFVRIDPEYEEQLGKLIVFKESTTLDKSIAEKLNHANDLLIRLCASGDYCKKIPKLTVSDQIKDKNALALPSYNIMFTKELLDDIRSDNELAFILAHELGHYKNRDNIRRFGRMIVVIPMVAIVAGEGEMAANIFFWLASLDLLSYSREQEHRADEFAVKAVYSLNGDPSEAINWLERNDKEVSVSWFLTHPNKRSRIGYLRELISNHK